VLVHVRLVSGALRLALPALVGIALGAACSTKPPAAGEGLRTAPAPAPVSPAEPAEPVAKPDPREAALAAASVRLLDSEHLLNKPIDDALSRTAFATYLDQLDANKLFLLAKDREALGRYADQIDDELRSGSLDLAHDGSKIFVARVAVVDKLVAALLAAPFNHDDDEAIELDPKKIEVATTEDELRERWRRRLELEVLERVAQLEARLEAQKPKPVASVEPRKPAGRPRPGAMVPGGATPKAQEGQKTAASDPPGHDGAPDDDDDARRTPTSKIPATREGRDAKVRAELAKTYAARFTRLRHPGVFDAASELINAVTASLDPHTTYLPPADKANFDIRMSGSLEGIGAQLRERDEYVEIIELVPGGASWRHGGLSPGDLILAVAADGQDPIDIADMKIDDVVKMIRGPKGTIVHLRIQKPTGAQETVSITRDVVVVEEAYARGAVLTRKGQPAVGYIYLPSFYGGRGAGQRTSAGDVRRLLAEMTASKVGGVVLDIRSNGGGLLGDSIEITGALIDQGPVVQVQDNRSRREVLRDDRPGTQFDGPVVVLVDRFSASASEILAGALQDYHRAIIVGTGATHGKGTVQTLADLSRVNGSKLDLGVLKITVQQFFRVSGASTQREGVTPDIFLPDPAGHIEAGERQLDHAIPWSQIAPAPHDDWAAGWTPSALATRSAARVAKQPTLARMAEVTRILKASRDDTRLPLARAAWEARRKQQRAAIEAASPDLKAQPARLSVTLLDDARPVVPAGPGVATDDRLARWRDNLARDPWVEECVNIVSDMAK
jgi:carboxyl-terminal processing protease